MIESRWMRLPLLVVAATWIQSCGARRFEGSKTKVNPAQEREPWGDPRRPIPGAAEVRTIRNGNRTYLLYSATPTDARRETLDMMVVVDKGRVRGEAGKEIEIVWTSESDVSAVADLEIEGDNEQVALPTRVQKDGTRYVVSAKMSAQRLVDNTKLSTRPRVIVDDRSFRLSLAQTAQLGRFLRLLPVRPDGLVTTESVLARERRAATGAREPRPAGAGSRSTKERERNTTNRGSLPRLIGFGTCFAVSPGGLLVTNNHVVAGADKIVVEFTKDRGHLAEIRSASIKHDLAILSIDSRTPSFLPVGRTKRLFRGDRVFTFGFPVPHLLGWELKYSDGTISALSVVNDASMLQTSIPIQPGNSGGPLVTTDGIVVGVITSKLKAAEFFKRTGSLPESIAFARKADVLIPLLGDLPKVKRAKNRREALRRTERATCRVYTYTN